MLRITRYILSSLSCCFVKADTDVPNHEMVPGIIISHSPASSGRYIGCPSIAVLPNGNYVASHSFFGFGSQNSKSAIYLSQNRGAEWTKQIEIKQWWSTLFVHNNLLYIIGVDGIYGNITIRRSEDGGTSWSTPKSSHSGLLLNGHYHCAPVPVVIHKGRIWRAFEKQNDGGWADKFSVFVMSAPVDADLLKSENWTRSNMLHWENWGSYKGWLEGNIVVSTDDKLVNILRVHEPNFGGKAAVVHISDDGKEITFNPHKDFIDLPGGCKKFTIRYDSESRQYWSLSNWVHPVDQNFPNKNFVRNTLALITSENLTNWEVRSVIMNYRNVHKTGFQYVDWLIEGNDMITVSRTAFDDGLDGANNAHDANYLTFHRIPNFRDRNIESKTLHNQNIDF